MSAISNLKERVVGGLSKKGGVRSGGSILMSVQIHSERKMGHYQLKKGEFMEVMPPMGIVLLFKVSNEFSISSVSTGDWFWTTFDSKISRCSSCSYEYIHIHSMG